MFRRTIKVKENEKVFLYKDEKLVDILGLGVHKGFFSSFTHSIEYCDFNQYALDKERVNNLFKLYPKLIEKHFTQVALEENERAYIFVDGKFSELLEAGAIMFYWKEYDIRVDRVDVEENYLMDTKYMKYIDKKSNPTNVKKISIEKNFEGYLFVDEVFKNKLNVGRHGFYTDLYNVDIKTVDKRIKTLEINAQELLSADKVTLRCNLTMHYKITDGERYLSMVDEPCEYLYKQLQFITREYLGSMKIDDILEKQHSFSKEILERFDAICLKIGVEVESVHIKDIILPGEMREIFNQVIEASKRAEANNIKRREETAATRSLLNTAKLMSDNPALVRLKELEALEKITSTIGTLNVYGGLEGVMNGLVDLKGNTRV